jgi:hypothetical protein
MMGSPDGAAALEARVSTNSSPSGRDTGLEHSMKLLTSSVVYFAIVFGAGFVFGMVRVMWLVPAVGVRIAVLTELPLMVAVVFVAARWVNRRFLAKRDQPARLIVGVTALVLLLLAELFVGVIILGLTPRDVFLNRDPVSGTAYYLSLCVFALMPWCLGRAGPTRRGADGMTSSNI